MTSLPAANSFSDQELEEGPFKQFLEDLLARAKEMPGGQPQSELTMAAGAVAPSGALHSVDTEGDAASDTLHTIGIGTLSEGALLLLWAADSARTVTVQHLNGGADGQIVLVGAANKALGTASPLVLKRAGSQWEEVVFAASSGSTATVRVATIGNINIATDLNVGDIQDGVTLAANDLVLLKDQTDPAENGVYPAGPSPTRDSGFAAYNDHPGALITVQEGTINGGTVWQCTSDRGGTLDTDPIEFLDFFTAVTPPGEITENYDEVARPGWVNLDGSTIIDGAIDNPRCAARYPWMVVGNNLVLPDRRGKFDRLWDNGAGNDPDAASRTARAGDGQTGDKPGTEQADAFQGHAHNGINNAVPGANQIVPGGGFWFNSATVATSGPVTDGVNGTPRTSSETRPPNHYVCKQMRLG